jgi:hypothetical protein
LDDKQLSLDEVLTTLIDNSFDKKYNDAYLNEIQHQINTNVLKYVMNLAVNDESYFTTKAVANKAISQLLKTFLNLQDTSMQYAIMTKEFYEHPEKFQLEASPKIPDGSPIGMDMCNYYPKLD